MNNEKLLKGNIDGKNIAYSEEDIERIFSQRVEMVYRQAMIKAGTICEWAFCYPNGACFADVECSFPMAADNFSLTQGKNLCSDKIKKKLWKICAMYSTATGAKL